MEERGYEKINLEGEQEILEEKVSSRNKFFKRREKYVREGMILEYK